MASWSDSTISLNDQTSPLDSSINSIRLVDAGSLPMDSPSNKFKASSLII